MIDTSLTEGIFNKNKRAISRSISVVETGNSHSAELLKAIHPKIGNAYRIGITGPPGAGKSTMANQLTKLYRKEGKTVGIIAVDPTSPFTGGAVLGDRIRMNDIGMDKGVYIRSMATRGSLGGLSKTTKDAGDVLDAAGYDIIIYETVGVGQSELDIAQAADTTVVMLVPESGDSVQAMKAGLMEIADMFVINKSDRPGARTAVTAIQAILALRDHGADDWMIEIIQTIATENDGIEKAAERIEAHRKYITETGMLYYKRKESSKLRIKEIVRNIIAHDIWDDKRNEHLNINVQKVVEGTLSPYRLAEDIIAAYKQEFK